MKKLILSIAVSTFAAGLASSAFAADATCAEQAAAKKLAGAAKNSFIKKCEGGDAKAPSACEGQAKEKKLHGAAKSSFVKKCEADAAAK